MSLRPQRLVIMRELDDHLALNCDCDVTKINDAVQNDQKCHIDALLHLGEEDFSQ